MSIATGVGSLPGEDFRSWLRIVLDELPDLPFLPELPARGPAAGMIGRSLAVVAELGFDLQPSGWRLTDASGVDHRRARSLLAHDLDVLEEEAQGYAGELKVQVAGPWTLAAAVERPRGDRLLADVGARRELAQALAEGARLHAGEVGRRVPGARVMVQVDEPGLPAVLAGQVPTASGFHRHRSVDVPLASEALGWLLGAVDEPIVHCCAADVPIRMLRQAGAAAVSVDLLTLGADAYEELGEAFDAGERVCAGVLPSVDAPLSERVVRDRVARLLDMLGLDPEEVSAQLVLTPACGLAGASADYARQALQVLRSAARPG